MLVIDDEAGIRSFLRRVLEKAGHTVSEAADGRDGVRLVERDRPDLMITDLFMPVQEGMETIRAARQLRPDLKIVAISGGGSQHIYDYLDSARLMGADQALKKPLRARIVLETVAALA
jgi:CheY-like chemotaxis protein